jgi:hemoglobin/transferrin/lactoferrin receptor protein
LNQYSPSGEDNLQYATVDGMPSWFILSYNVNIQFIKNSIIQLGVENILDKNYRYFASGISTAGRNFSVSIKQSF